MKGLILLVVLAVLSAGDGAVYQNAVSRANMQQGVPQYGDRLLNRTYLQRAAINNAVQYQDYIYRGNATTRISSVQATEVGLTQFGSAWIIQGGVGWNTVTVRVQSQRSRGYYYMIDVWGR